jgi:hypothetical protein
MKEFIKIGALVVIAVMAGVFSVYAGWIPDGVRTTGIAISGEGEGEGEPADDTLTFEKTGLLYFSDGGIEVFHPSGSVSFLDDSAGYAYLVGNTCAEVFSDPGMTGYVSWNAASELCLITGKTGAVVAGDMRSSGDGPVGASLFAYAEEDDMSQPRAAVHVDPQGGLTEEAAEGEGEEDGPSVDIAVFDADLSPSALVRLDGNSEHGEVEMINNTNASVKVTETGNVVITLGSPPQGQGMAASRGLGNRSATSSQASESTAATPDLKPKWILPSPKRPEALFPKSGS